MTEQREQMQGQFRPWEVRVLVALAVLLVAAAVVSVAAPQYAKPETWQAWWQGPAVEAQVQPAQRSIGPAPTLKKGPKVKYKGKLVSRWKATGAGDSSYNGLYIQVGGETYNGHPVYRLAGNPTGKALWWTGAWWALSETPGGSYDYGYTGDSGQALPANPWSTGLCGTPPAPTLAATPPINPPSGDWTHPYATYWLTLPNMVYTPSVTFRPARGYLGTPEDPTYEVVVFAYNDTHSSEYGFSIFWVYTQTWTYLELDTTPMFAAGEFDPYQGGTVIMDPDGIHAWVLSGAWLDGAQHKFTCQKWNLSGATEAVLVSSTEVNVTGLQLSYPAVMADDTLRFMVDDSTDWLMLAYTLGGASVTTVASFSGVPVLPSPYAIVEFGATGRQDIVLYRRTNGDLAWMHHCVYGRQHRIIYCEVTEDYCLQLDDLLKPSAHNYYQTYGQYAMGNLIVTEHGTTSPFPALRWVPGEDAVKSTPFCYFPAGRAWFLDGSPLLMAGKGGYFSGWRPFVLVAAPSTGGANFADFTPVGYDATAARIAYANYADFTPAGYDPTAAKLMVAAPDFADFTPEGYDALALKVADRTPSNSAANWKWVRARVIPS